MNNQDKNSQNNENKTDSSSTNEKSNPNSDQDWKVKLGDIVQTCQSEFKKTTKIGMKMIHASQSNAQLHENYETIGKWLVEQVNSGSIKIDDVEIEGLVAKVKELEGQLEDFEQDVQDIKKE